jgi:hypothetical protein
VHIKHARVERVTPGNTEYTKYDPPGAKNSHDVLAKDTIVHSFLSAKKQVPRTVATGGFLKSNFKSNWF